MDRTESLLEKYGLEPTKEHRDILKELLGRESSNEKRKDNEYLKTLCILLYTYGIAEDTLQIWMAKNIDFDTGCYIDGELLIGAGLEETISYLKTLKTAEADKELDYLANLETNGRDKVLEFYRNYYGLN
ncbi:hypothetical protein ACFPES_03900 [Paenibacillus sp. GCM10023248]|uniref:hypothetical protein n=1 Tax=unclassified Paenibacillus TaxID=185978 RepID=UPI0023783945|nr:hypothetical protein [Paenibacillus sp. MAHUQ-63]MDD9266171.1 hypothetical protein [Paenibacillus sp. MAHUQ-63]